ncbi:DUF6624 domain-containing protein [Algoriphagus machipongonensis]|uniref:Lipoprotein n=1 Tax=Algoriphagus machipongonensis TaxID=388413 RepID=A3HSV1_9BACT|nr:DUF6624 domain-containing protein [Algoriphagus machipongonensis]EAZ82919.1 hypothetical protein ALPR1_11900 [Algoriphagus machipongonensis]
MKLINLFTLIILLTVASCNQGKRVTEMEQPDSSNNIDQEYLVALLDTIWKNEQDPIQLRDSLGKVYGYESEEFQEQNEIYHRNHDINEKKILEILDTQGWPSQKIIGEQGNLTICNVLQHSGLEVRKKYLPMMKKAVEEKELAPRLFARAEDRLATDRGDLQIYGGQIKYYPETKSFDVWPIMDPANVDQRRAEIGMVPMTEFLSNLRNPLKWDLEKQIKRTEEFLKEKQTMKH